MPRTNRERRSTLQIKLDILGSLYQGETLPTRIQFDVGICYIMFCRHIKDLESNGLVKRTNVVNPAQIPIIDTDTFSISLLNMGSNKTRRNTRSPVRFSITDKGSKLYEELMSRDSVLHLVWCHLVW